MANQTIFKRYEYKYLLTADQKKDLLAYMETYMKPDTFGRKIGRASCRERVLRLV